MDFKWGWLGFKEKVEFPLQILGSRKKVMFKDKGAKRSYGDPEHRENWGGGKQEDAETN